MATNNYKVKHSNLLFIALLLLWSFVLSCEAESSAQLIFEPAPGSPISIPCGPGNIITGDLNNDGKPDIVAECRENRTIIVFIGEGNGQFDVGSPIQLQYPPTEIEIADMNNDDHADLIIASHDSYEILILPGDGKGVLQLRQVI